MVPAANRLKGKRNFSRLAKHGRSFFSNGISARVVQNGLSQCRFAFVVSLRVSKRAVERNKLKRRLREIIRKNLGSFSGGYDVLIGVKPLAVKKTHQELQHDLISLLKKTDVIL